MRKLLVLSIFSAAAILFSACAVGPTPQPGLLYTDVKSPFHVTDVADGGKSGKACATSILYLWSTGDASIKQAMKSGGITQVTSVDYSTKWYLGFVWSEFCTEVTGK
ncbi:MAG: hypothetical protein HY280_11230 [Nitrospinae bacterium]|nr:hypothetical protein [Nitrospinota bacterium]